MPPPQTKSFQVIEARPSSCRGARRQVAPTRGPHEGLLGANVFTRASSELLPVLARHPEAF